MRTISLMLLSIFCFALSSCSSEEIRQPENEKQHRDTPYARALAKLKRANELTGQHRTRSGTDGVQGVIPLCYGDTGTFNPGTGTDNPDIPPGPGYVDPEEWSPENDSIYAYVFDYENGGGYTVVTTEDWMPDVLMYSNEGNFFGARKTPPPIASNDTTPAAQNSEWLKYIEWNEIEYRRLLASAAMAMLDIFRKEKLYHGDYGVDLGSSGYVPPKYVGMTELSPYTTSYIYGDKNGGTCKVKWNDLNPYDTIAKINCGENAKNWPIVSTTARYLSIIRPSDNYNGLDLNWELWTSDSDINDVGEDTMFDVATLYWFLSSSENLNVDFFKSMPETAIFAVPRTLRNFGFDENFTIEERYSRIYDATLANSEAGYPTLLQYKTNSNVVTSFIIDEHHINTKKIIAHYDNYPDMNQTLECEFFHFNNGECTGYINWSVVYPGFMLKGRPKYNPLYNPQPAINPALDNLKVLNVLGVEIA